MFSRAWLLYDALRSPSDCTYLSGNVHMLPDANRVVLILVSMRLGDQGNSK